MIRQIEGLPRQVFGYEAEGQVTYEEVDEVMGAFDATIADGYDVELLVEYHADVVEAPRDEETRFRNRLSARGRTRRLAFVGDDKWRTRVDDFASFVGCDVHMFPPGQRDAALAWLREAPFRKDRGDAG